jgi:hypothetical protein
VHLGDLKPGQTLAVPQVLSIAAGEDYEEQRWYIKRSKVERFPLRPAGSSPH